MTETFIRRKQFEEAAKNILGQETFDVACMAHGRNVNDLCITVAKAILINEADMTQVDSLKIVSTTARHLWRGSGCHELK
jgi:hypothetical protein